MPSLQEELKNVEQQEDDFYKNHPKLSSLDKAIGNSEGIVLSAGIAVVFLGTVIVRWIFYHFPTWRELILIGMFTYILGAILTSIFADLFYRKYQNYLFRKYATDRATYEALIRQRTKFRTQKSDLGISINRQYSGKILSF